MTLKITLICDRPGCDEVLDASNYRRDMPANLAVNSAVASSAWLVERSGARAPLRHYCGNCGPSTTHGRFTKVNHKD